MSSVHANNVVDLVRTSPSSSSPPMSRRNNQRSNRKRRSPRHNNDNGKMAAAARSPEVIDLLADLDDSPPPPAGLPTMNNSISKKRSGKKRRRPAPRSAGIINVNDGDDDVVEIIEPSSRTNSSVAAFASASASTAAASSMKQPQQQSTSNNDMNLVERIREVFPLVSRAKVETFLSTAKSYSTDENNSDESVFLTVMTVLSEDPLGTSISDATFAAAAIGGRLEGGSSTSSGGNDMSLGRRKVAQLECQCCYVEYDFELMVSCRTGGHLFCKTCLQKHTEQRVFGIGNFGVKNDNNNNNGGKNGNNANHNGSSKTKALEILCMASDCTSGFNEIQLRKALSEKVLKKYNELQYAAVIESANMGDISKCSKCDFTAVADEKWPPNLFHCPRCNFKSCKECGEEYHPEIRCDQVESKKETSGRTTVEEAMTLALVRTCPRPMCRKKFMKSDGCNKMTCSCGCFVCYVCRKEIPAALSYKHFCQTPHCKHKTCNLCPLYADTSEADKTRVTNAAKKAARSVRKNVRVDVNAILKDPPPPPFGRRR